MGAAAPPNKKYSLQRAEGGGSSEGVSALSFFREKGLVTAATADAPPPARTAPNAAAAAPRACILMAASRVPHAWRGGHVDPGGDGRRPSKAPIKSHAKRASANE